jgi:hypothetical protein
MNNSRLFEGPAWQLWPRPAGTSPSDVIPSDAASPQSPLHAASLVRVTPDRVVPPRPLDYAVASFGPVGCPPNG